MLRRPDMDRTYALATDLHVRLVRLADWLCGCSHCGTTFPMTLLARAALVTALDSVGRGSR
jgi:hypothetical protein